jgi:hypothetical protein
MNLSDMQLMYGDLLMGRGTPYDVNWETIGLLDLPPIRGTDTDRARGDGAWSGEEFAGAQTFPVSVLMTGRLRVPLSTAVEALRSETTPRVPRDLWFKVPHMDEPRCLLGVRVRRRAIPIARGFDQVVRAEFDLRANDPARYGPEMQLNVLADSRDRVAGVNQGDLDAWPKFYLSHPQGISGPVSILHLETGSRIAINTRTAPGEVLVIDQEVGTAVVDYVSDRSTALTARQWWTASPKSSFTVALEAPAGTSMDVGWRASWW